jgi:hypothetical protein
MDFDVLELREVGDQVLATVRDVLTGRVSGVPVQALHYTVWTLAAGKVVRLQALTIAAEPWMR